MSERKVASVSRSGDRARRQAVPRVMFVTSSRHRAPDVRHRLSDDTCAGPGAFGALAEAMGNAMTGLAEGMAEGMAEAFKEGFTGDEHRTGGTER